MILANLSQVNRNTARDFGAAFSNVPGVLKPTVFQNRFTSDVGVSLTLAGMAHGYNTNYAWGLPLSSGGLASTLNIVGSATMDGDALAVKLATAAVTGSGDLTAIGGLVVQLLASIAASGGITEGDVKAFLQAAAALSGTGGVDDAALTAFAELVAAVSGAGDIDDATLTAIGELLADLVVTGTGLSTANVGPAVWSALASTNNAANTMGEKLNAAGSAGDPLTGSVEGSLSMRDALRLMLAVMTGKTTVSGNTITFRDNADTKDRVTATMSGRNRTNVDLDAS